MGNFESRTNVFSHRMRKLNSNTRKMRKDLFKKQEYDSTDIEKVNDLIRQFNSLKQDIREIREEISSKIGDEAE